MSQSHEQCAKCGKIHHTKKIALEEAISTSATSAYLDSTLKVASSEQDKKGLRQKLESNELRLQAMKKAGIDLFVLSQTSPGVQVEKDAAKAVENAKATNVALAELVKANPTQYRAFAHLPMQDVKAAREELKRCVKDYGFLGALINGSTKGVYLDDEIYLDFWEDVAKLKVPVYLHPADPYGQHGQPEVLEGYSVMQGAVWGWTTENSSHFLRLLFSGLFDRFPELTLILGHMGETLPYFASRIDGRYERMGDPDRPKVKKAPSEYFRSNLIITTSGVCQDSSLRCAMEVMGEERVLFSVDYPFEEPEDASCWIESSKVLTNETRKAVCYENAQRVLNIRDF